MTARPFDPELPTTETLAGINFEMEGAINRAVKSSPIQTGTPPPLSSTPPTAEDLAGINVDIAAAQPPVGP